MVLEIGVNKICFRCTLKMLGAMTIAFLLETANTFLKLDESTLNLLLFNIIIKCKLNQIEIYVENRG